MEIFEQIRREYEFGVGTIQGVARKLGVHRRMVREAIRSAVPVRRKRTERPRTKMVAAVAAWAPVTTGQAATPRTAAATEATMTRGRPRLIDNRLPCRATPGQGIHPIFML